jgi:hypothetical protein
LAQPRIVRPLRLLERAARGGHGGFGVTALRCGVAPERCAIGRIVALAPCAASRWLPVTVDEVESVLLDGHAAVMWFC